MWVIIYYCCFKAGNPQKAEYMYISFEFRPANMTSYIRPTRMTEWFIFLQGMWSWAKKCTPYTVGEKTQRVSIKVTLLIF